MYSRKKPVEELPTEMTAVWQCENEGCNGWMRDDFAFEEIPICRQCMSPMVSGVKDLPVIVNTSRTQKNFKKGVPIAEC